MAIALGLILDRLASLLAGVSMLGVAAWLFYLDPARRLTRAFALLLVLRGAFIGLLAFGVTLDDLGARIRAYFAIAVPFAALFFAYVYLSEHRRLAHRTRALPGRAVPAALFVLCAAAELAYAWDHRLLNDGGRPGPLTLFVPGAYASFALMALLFGLDHGATRPGAARTGLYLGALGFALEPLYVATWRALVAGIDTVRAGTVDALSLRSTVVLLELVVALLPLFLIGVLAVAMARQGRTRPADAAPARRFLLVLLLPMASAVVIAGVYWSEQATGGAYFINTMFAVSAVWALAAPACVTFALVRHRFLDIDVRARLSIERGSIAAVVVAVFFVVTELAQQYFQDTLGGAYAGIGAAALLLLTLHGLHTQVARLSTAVIPGAPPPHALSLKQRGDLYREHVEAAWMDGTLTRAERAHLDRVRDALALPRDEAGRIELQTVEALAAAGPGPGPRRRRAAPEERDPETAR